MILVAARQRVKRGGSQLRRHEQRQGAAICLTVAIVLSALLGGTRSAMAQDTTDQLSVRTVRLDNGLTALLLPRDGAPTVSFVVQYGIGGIHERLGTTGIAHLLEHLLFKGSKTIGTRDYEAEAELFPLMDALHDEALAVVPRDSAQADRLRARIEVLEDSARQFVEPNEFDRILTRAGARGLNATTANEATIYFVELPANRSELFFVLEADRMTDPVFREFYTERDVVMEERRMRVETSPGGSLYEAHLGSAFHVHPYGVPVVGHRSDLESLRRPDVERYYRDFYGPNNAVLAVVGSFDPDEMEGWIRSYLGPVPRGRDPPPVLAVEPEQRGERRVELSWDAEPMLRIGWRIPELAHPDAPALAMLSALLTGGRASRLHRRLVTEEGRATSVFASLGPGILFPRLFQLDVVPIAPTTTADLEQAIYEEVERIARSGPAEDELRRIRTQLEAGNVRRLTSNLGLAFQLAESQSMLGDWRETFRNTARLTGVTADDVRRVAAEYLTRERRTVATLVRREGS